MTNSPASETALAMCEECRRSLWDLIQKTPDVLSGKAMPETGPLQQNEQADPQAESVAVDARELAESKLLKQLSEMTHLLEQQTTILHAQQKLLEDLTGRQKKPEKRKPGMGKKIKQLIHKGKIIWSAL